MANKKEAAPPDWDYYFQTPVLVAEQVAGGYANDVWHVRTEGGDYIVKITKRPHLVMERLPGEPLDLEEGEDRERLARSLGGHLGQLHKATFSDWGCYPEPRYPADAWPKRLAATLSFMAYAWYEEDETVLAPLDGLVEQARQLAIATSELLRERNWGIYDGKRPISSGRRRER